MVQQVASHEEIRFLTLRETPVVYETLPCPGATWEDMDEAALRKYLTVRAPGALEQQGLTLTALATTLQFATQRGGGNASDSSGHRAVWPAPLAAVQLALDCAAL